MRVLLALTLTVASTLSMAYTDNLPRINSVPAQPAAGDRFELQISGTWPDGCGPRLDRVERTGFNIDVTIGNAPEGVFCTAALTPINQKIPVFSGSATAQAGTYRVRYYLQQPNTTTRRLLAFELISVDGDSAAKPEAGYWAAESGGEFATSGSGVGFELERQKSQVFLAGNVYLDDGTPSWIIAAGPLSGSAAKGDLLRASGGQALFSSYRAPSQIDTMGRVQLEFKSSTTAVFWFSRASDEGLLGALELMPVSVNRFNFGFGPVAQSFAGRWMVAVEGQPARVVDLIAHRYGAANLVGAISADFSVRLECTTDPLRQNTLPQNCLLYDDATLLGTMTAVGLSGLTGRTDSGKVVFMQRLD